MGNSTPWQTQVPGPLATFAEAVQEMSGRIVADPTACLGLYTAETPVSASKLHLLGRIKCTVADGVTVPASFRMLRWPMMRLVLQSYCQLRPSRLNTLGVRWSRIRERPV